jgi:glyoxylase-like metal-dependent hydrolase (beta-lactamase superfamily II)
VAAGELAAAKWPQTLREHERYRPKQWEHGPRWKTHGAGGENWNGFAGVRALEGLPPEILLVPLVGHTRGHHGVAVNSGAGWMLHAGDAYFHYGEVAPRRSCPVVLRAFQSILEIDRKARLANQARLRTLANDPTAGVRVFCAHDPSELQQCLAAR